jgi:hypothetical protein
VRVVYIAVHDLLRFKRIGLDVSEAPDVRRASDPWVTELRLLKEAEIIGIIVDPHEIAQPSFRARRQFQQSLPRCLGSKGLRLPAVCFRLTPDYRRQLATGSDCRDPIEMPDGPGQ